MNTKNVFMVTLTGLAFGTALGLMLAPNKGKNLREKITRKGENLIDELKDKFESFICEIRDQIDKAKDETEYKVSTAKSNGREILDGVKSALR